MDHPLIDLINARIAKAEADGAFDNLPGAGKPLPECDDPQNALFNRLIRENGAVPEFISLSRELAGLREELRDCADRTRRRELMQNMSMMETRIEMAKRDFKRG
ncbi:DUF1992 domain-containing protein [Thalassovita sp.]|jgi:hypothetical protein|uniref:DnaJ family domain-containing protein n=1 Tax=Thalassovita sp. TaxID=1979401 RepID=UPI0029DE7C32|nr:DUF1992 domain-containing protein [Thalassovita sp.]